MVAVTRAAERVLEIDDPPRSGNDRMPHSGADLRGSDTASPGLAVGERVAGLHERPDRHPLAVHRIERPHPRHLCPVVRGTVTLGRREISAQPEQAAALGLGTNLGVGEPVDVSRHELLEVVDVLLGVRVRVPEDHALAVIRVTQPTIGRQPREMLLSWLRAAAAPLALACCMSISSVEHPAGRLRSPQPTDSASDPGSHGTDRPRGSHP